MPSPADTRSLDQLTLELSVASERLRAVWRHDLGISAYEMLAITHLASAGMLTIGELGSRLALSSGAMTGLVDRLEKTGRIQRVRDERDRRRVHLTVTPETAGDLDRLAAPLRGRIAVVDRAPLDPAATVARLLECYTQTIEEHP